MAGDAEEKAGRHRNGQKISDEAEPEDAGANENEPDCKAERRRSCRIMLWPRRRERRKRAGENRRDGRIGADGKAPMRPEKALATPTPTKSRLTSGPSALLGKDRVVAAVCTITTSAMSTASGATT